MSTALIAAIGGTASFFVIVAPLAIAADWVGTKIRKLRR